MYQSAHAYCTARAYLTYMCSTLTFRLLRNKPILCCTCVTCFIATFHCIKVHHKFEFNLFGVGGIVSRQHLPSRHLKKKDKNKNDCEYCDSLLSSTKDCTYVSVCTRISYSACIFNYMCSTLVFRLLCNKPIFCLQLPVKFYLSKKSRGSVQRRTSLPKRLTTE